MPITLERTDGWELRFSQFLRDRAAMPFAWGTNDCLLFCVDAVAVVTGVDFAEAQRGYTFEDATKGLEEKRLDRLISEYLGPPHNRFLQARRADVVVINADGALAGGMVDDSGQRIAVLGPKGLHRVPLTEARRIWSY